MQARRQTTCIVNDLTGNGRVNRSNRISIFNQNTSVFFSPFFFWWLWPSRTWNEKKKFLIFFFGRSRKKNPFRLVTRDRFDSGSLPLRCCNIAKFWQLNCSQGLADTNEWMKGKMQFKWKVETIAPRRLGSDSFQFGKKQCWWCLQIFAYYTWSVLMDSSRKWMPFFLFHVMTDRTMILMSRGQIPPRTSRERKRKSFFFVFAIECFLQSVYRKLWTEIWRPFLPTTMKASWKRQIAGEKIM